MHQQATNNAVNHTCEYKKKREQIKKTLTNISGTRMVQLPATAAIEYVAAGHFFPGGLLAGAYTSVSTGRVRIIYA